MFIISIEYGEWEDFRSKDVFLCADESEARAMMVTIVERASAICAEAQDRFIYNGEQPFQAWYNSTDPFEQIMASCHGDSVTLVLSRIPLGQITNGRERLVNEHAEVFSFDMDLDDVVETVYNDPEMKYESMAFTYERSMYGWRAY
jgi:hypothetical protein